MQSKYLIKWFERELQFDEKYLRREISNTVCLCMGTDGSDVLQQPKRRLLQQDEVTGAST